MGRKFTMSIDLVDKEDPYAPLVIQDEMDKKKIVNELCRVIQMLENGYFGGDDNKGTHWEISDLIGGK